MKLRSGCHATLAFVFAGFVLALGCSSSSDGSDEGADLSDSGDLLVTVDLPGDASEVLSQAAGRISSALDKACTPPVQQLVINEIMVDPDAVTDLYGEWVEIYNPTKTAVDLLNWRLKDQGTPVQNHLINQSLEIPPDGYLVLCRNSDVALNKGLPCDYMYTSFTLTNTADAVLLVNPSGTVVDQVVFSGVVPTGASVALRNPYLAHDTLTCPPSPNSPASWVGLAFGLSTSVSANGDKGTPGARNDDVWEDVPSTDCNDNNLCSIDRCVAEVCRYTQKTDCCEVDGDCNDGVLCTADTCNLETNLCVYTEIEDCCRLNEDCVDANPCNGDYCINGKCRHSNWNILPGCCYAPGDTNPATGLPWANPEERQAYADAQCDDKNVCTPDFCTQATNVCGVGPLRTGCCVGAGECDDLDPCTYDSCDANTCSHTRTFNCCQVDQDCNDNNACTKDYCIINRCRPFWDTEACCYIHTDCPDDNNPCTEEKCLLSETSGRFECAYPLKDNCTFEIPYVQAFESTSGLQEIGWKIRDYKTSTVSPNHWQVTNQGLLGHDHDPSIPSDPVDEQSLKFTWTPTTLLVKSVAMTPSLNALTSKNDSYNITGVTTVQWRMLYRHSQPGGTVSLKVVAAANGASFEGAPVLLQWDNISEDVPYTLFTAELPEALEFSQSLKIGFMIDTATTFNMEAFEIDDVKIAAGKPNRYIKSKVYKCPTGATTCEANATTFVQEASAPDPVPTITAGVNDWYRIYLCLYDEDASTFTWGFAGFPGSFIDSEPMDRPLFLRSAAGVGQANGCETVPSGVAAVCGVQAGSTKGYYYCGIDVKPEGNVDYAGSYAAALVVRDEYDPALPLHSPFESQTKFNINLMLEDGYIVWSPNGRDDPEAILIRDAIKANNRPVQIVRDLSLLTDLSKFDGIFVSLGIFGKHYKINAAEAARLKVYLDNGGRIYLEGGDYFYKQTDFPLSGYFKAEATSDGLAKLDGPLAGRSFMLGYDFDYDQGALTNFFNDRLVHTPEAGGREIFRNAGTRSFATVVAYEVPEGSGVPVYRTIGSSVLFGGFIPKDGSRTTRELMGRYIGFLENGYPDCTTVEHCEDDEVCTDDSCGGDSRCVNAARPGCIPCLDDKVRKDGTPSCPIDQACKLTLGYCVDIPFEDRFDTPVASCSKFFGSGPVSADCDVTVTRPATIDDIQVKAKVSHNYRGDVQLTLRSPQGTQVKLKAASAADANQNVYFTYDTGLPAAESLNAFDGQHLEGTWKLVAEDTDPAIYNGLLESWHLFATHHEPVCTVVEDCEPDPCATVECVDIDGDGALTCHYTPMDCDDLKDCTVDYCDPATQACVHDPIIGSGCGCKNHDECPESEACLDTSKSRACDLLLDEDPVTGEVGCTCSPFEGTPYEMTTGLPAGIPDNDATGITKILTVNAPGMVNRLKVRVKTDHTGMGDLRALLCHEGTCLTLRNLKGGNAPGFHDVYEFDAVAGPGSLADFRKLPVAGEWTLTLSDNIATEEGELTRFILYVVQADCFKPADCDDGNSCTTDTCQNPSEGGTCVHTGKPCEPSTDPCRAQQCNPTTGECELMDQPNGTPCEDGLYCTEDDSCMAGVCTGGAPRDCTTLNGNCLVGSCNEDLKQCQPLAAPDGAACDDGESCTGGDTCTAGMCMPGTNLACPCPHGLDSECADVDDGNKCNGVLWRCNASKMCEPADSPVVCPPAGTVCTRNVCDSYDGICKIETSLNYSPCEDGLFCSVADYCESGECKMGLARDCSSIDDDCKVGVCDEASGSCITDNKPEGTLCELDGRGCTVDECSAGTCGYSRNIDCSIVNDDCNDGVCQNVGWGGYVCVKGPLVDGTICTDEPNPCTDDRCDTGLCRHILLENCNGPCGGDHPFDAGDDVCGKEDSCQNGIAGSPNGSCVPTCIAPNCVRAASPLLDKPIDERLTCTVGALDISTAFTYVEGIEAKVRLSHGSLQDLTVDIIDPQGYAHRVWNHIGGSNQDFANTFDLSFPVPYPGIQTSGVPMCALAGELASGTWYLKVCDTGVGGGGVLHDWKLYVRGSMDPALNMGHRCDDAIDLGSHPVVPTITVDGTTQCALNSIQNAGCGGNQGLDRLYKFRLTQPRRVTIKLQQPTRDMILYLIASDGDTCAPGKIECSQNGGVGAAAEIVDRQLEPGLYFVGVDTEGGPYDYGAFRYEIRIKDLLEDGSPCDGEGVNGVVGPQDLDCMSNHCQNGYCCQGTLTDCCPGEAWPVPADGTNPLLVKATPDWISADTICPAKYKADPVCNDAEMIGVPPSLINECQGQRHDANCVNHVCEKTRVDDDTACDESVESSNCGLWNSIFCADDGPFPPAAQLRPTCPTYCVGDEDCDLVAHCDPAVATVPDDPPSHTMTCQTDLLNGKACNEHSDCASGHCQNGFCCESGDCCPSDDTAGALECPGIYTTPPSCKDATTCKGERSDPVCSLNICGSVNVRDDCACNGSLSDNCGFFIPVFCGGAPSGTCPATGVGDYTTLGDGSFEAWVNGDPQCLTSCLVGGVEDDTRCDDGFCDGTGCHGVATCDPCDQALVDRGLCTPAQVGNDSVCQGAYPNGYPCNEAGDCENKMRLPPDGAAGGHCQNGFCCDFGDCCALPADCPSGTRMDPVCDLFTTCQGHRRDSTCPITTFSCGTVAVDDDRACVYDDARPSDECSFYLPIFCNGAEDQIDPPCPTTCLVTGVEDDLKCDPNAHCDPDTNLPNQTNSICLEDLPNDEICDEPTDCGSGFCQIHFCCDPNGCCNGCRVDNAILSLSNGGTGSPRVDVAPVDLNQDVSPTAGPGGTAIHVQTVWGAESSVGRLAAANSRTVDLGPLATSTMPVFCYNRVRDVTETDVDCGGGLCQKCPGTMECAVGSRDCASGVCDKGFCTMPATCTDTVKNGSETDLNCGGGLCPRCALTKVCAEGTRDCQSGFCDNGICR